MEEEQCPYCRGHRTKECKEGSDEYLCHDCYKNFQSKETRTDVQSHLIL